MPKIDIRRLTDVVDDLPLLSIKTKSIDIRNQDPKWMKLAFLANCCIPKKGHLKSHLNIFRAHHGYCCASASVLERGVIEDDASF
ncbi:predicted protein [Sclerotinia sclerotiorum 1980 UF-70]|uniref:Uncharacterized protein n=1 Tax=Sclerotinia sclerotiorum (strain ATCC 18683 / 1980 / Ss-1) TaxID=665079 RepID=A7F0G0_SCLS1|nr:predicted protein [Sclerotinia sclerotiorum 1980 UF-70]EDN95202.1 predicted protein [Sclerotinia sclerotiorum 1980 UF-70]